MAINIRPVAKKQWMNELSKYDNRSEQINMVQFEQVRLEVSRLSNAKRVHGGT